MTIYLARTPGLVVWFAYLSEKWNRVDVQLHSRFKSILGFHMVCFPFLGLPQDIFEICGLPHGLFVIFFLWQDKWLFWIELYRWMWCVNIFFMCQWTILTAFVSWGVFWISIKYDWLLIWIIIGNPFRTLHTFYLFQIGMRAMCERL